MGYCNSYSNREMIFFNFKFICFFIFLNNKNNFKRKEFLSQHQKIIKDIKKYFL